MKIVSKFGKKMNDGSALFQYLAMLSGTLGIICSGMHYAWPSPSLPRLLQEDSHIHITNEEGSWLAVMPLVGATCGSLLGAFTLDILGRKKVVLITTFPFFTAWIIVAFASSSWMLIFARFIAGMADGLLFCAIPMYLGEIADPRIRGFLGSSVSVTWTLGMLLINAIGSYLDITTAALISSIFPILNLLTFCWMPESPYFLCMRENFDEARNSLKIFRGTADVDNELLRLKKAVKIQSESTGRFWDLFTIKSNRRAVYIMMGLRATQQLSGVTAVVFYAQTIFQRTGENISPEIFTIIYFLIQLVMTALTSAVVDRTGRRPLLIGSLIGTASALFIEGAYFYVQENFHINATQLSFVPATTLFLFVVFFSFGMQSVPILMLGEIFATNVKAFALSFADIYFSIIATAVSKFFQISKDSFGMYVPFFVFSICCLVGLVFVVLCIPETKGKTLEEIQLYFQGNCDKAQTDSKNNSEV